MKKPATEAARSARILEINSEIARLTDEQRRLIEQDFVHETIVAHTKVIPEPDTSVLDSLKASESLTDRSAKTRSDSVRLAEVLKLTGATKRTIYRWMDDEELRFPRPTIERGVALWSKFDVEVWLRTQKDNLGRWPSAGSRHSS